MDGYVLGIAYATGYIANDADLPYLVVRNLDRWYPDQVAKISKYNVYASMHNVVRDGKPQYTIKARDINTCPCLYDATDKIGFLRAYIEIHAVLDIMHTRRKNKLRLRIYGNEDILSFINSVLPATLKKIQHIKNKSGSTYAIYYQSTSEIYVILDYINGDIKNQKIWDKWEDTIKNAE